MINYFIKKSRHKNKKLLQAEIKQEIDKHPISQIDRLYVLWNQIRKEKTK